MSRLAARILAGLAGELTQNFGDLPDRPGRLLLGDDIRRHEIENIPERTQEQAPLEERRGEARANLVEIAAGIRQLDDPDAPQHTHVADDWQRTHWRETRAQLRFKPLHAIEGALRGEQVEAGERHRARQRVGGE